MRQTSRISFRSSTDTAIGKPFDWFLGALAGLFLISGSLLGLREFFNPTYDWDLDTEIYFGQRLLHGELIWTREYHDKLPLVQVVFSLVGAAGSILVWRAISLSMFLLASITVLVLLTKILVSSGWENHKSVLAGWLGVGVSLSLTVSLPGSYSSINSFASSAAIVSTLCAVRMTQQRQLQQLYFPSLLLGASLAGVVAVSFRPYFFVALGFVFLTASCSIGLRFWSRDRTKALLSILAILIVPGILGLVLNAGPYLVYGNFGAFVRGVSFMAQTLNPTPAIMSIVSDTQSILFLTAMVMLAVVGILVSFLPAKPTRYLLRILSLSALLLLATILTRHWWNHYSTMFSWHFAVLFAVLAVWMVRANDQFELSRLRAPLRNWLSVVAICTTVVISVFPLRMLPITDFAQSQQGTKEAEVFESWLKSQSGDIAFLAPENMLLHWKLRESRHGFPHAANTAHIRMGWWSEIDPSVDFISPRSTIEYCELLWNEGPNVIVLPPDSEFENCLNPNIRERFRHQELVSPDGEIEVEIFIRDKTSLLAISG